jgi:hypothetical protein
MDQLLTYVLMNRALSCLLENSKKLLSFFFFFVESFRSVNISGLME